MPTPTVRDRLVRVVLESDTRAGRLYNLVVFAAILLSVVGRQVGRILRVFKLLRFMDEARALGAALKTSARRISVFIAIFTGIVTVQGVAPGWGTGRSPNSQL